MTTIDRHDKKYLYYFLSFSPLSVWTVRNFVDLSYEFRLVKDHLFDRLVNVFAIYNLRYIDELRVVNVYFLPGFKRLFYNKLTLIASLVFDSLSKLSPHNYFFRITSFEHYQLNELIPFIFIPFWFGAVFGLIKENNKKVFIKLLVFSMFCELVLDGAYIAYLPVAYYYLYMSVKKFLAFSIKSQLIRITFFIYNLYGIWLVLQ